MHTDPEIKSIIRSLERFIPDPSIGLPEEVFEFISRTTPLVNVDLLIKDNTGRSLLTWRDDGIYETGWHVPGGVVRFKETLEDRIHRVAKNEIDAEVAFGPEPLFIHQAIHPTRLVRGHSISFLFKCTLVSGPDEKLHHRDGHPKPGE